MNPLTLLYSLTALAAVPSVPVHAPARPANVDSVPAAPGPADSVLTVDVVTRMTTFWKSLSDEDKLLLMKTRNYSKIPVCHVQGSVEELGIMTRSDSNPKLLAAFKHAGLSAQKYQLYQHLIESAWITKDRMTNATRWDIMNKNNCQVTKVEQVNIDFINAHLSELTALAPGVFTDENLKFLSHPAFVG